MNIVGRHMEEISLLSTIWKEHILDHNTASIASSLLGSFKCLKPGCDMVFESEADMVEHLLKHP